MRVLMVLFINSTSLFFIAKYISDGPVRLCITCFCSAIVLSLGIYCLGFEKDERNFVIKIITQQKRIFIRIRQYL